MERGIIAQISGPVVDVEIVQGELPRLREMLTVEKNGEHRVMEVAQHVGGSREIGRASCRERVYGLV